MVSERHVLMELTEEERELIEALRERNTVTQYLLAVQVSTAHLRAVLIGMQESNNVRAATLASWRREQGES
jgi:DNA-binding MarR family transcriptional regulator